MAATLTVAVLGFTIAVTIQRNKAIEQERIAIEEKGKAEKAAEAEKQAKEIAVDEQKIGEGAFFNDAEPAGIRIAQA